MGEPARYLFPADRMPGEVDRFGWPGVSLSRGELSEGTVRPTGVVVQQVLGQYLAQVVVLDRLLIVNEHHLRKVLTEYLLHYNTGRSHRALGQLTPAQADTGPPEPVNLAEHPIRRKQVLGGLTHEYYVAALPAPHATENAGHPRLVFPSPTGSGGGPEPRRGAGRARRAGRRAGALAVDRNAR